MHHNDDPDAGFALLIVIFGLGLLSVLALSYNLAIRAHVRAANNEIQAMRAEGLAEAGIALGIFRLVTLAKGQPSVVPALDQSDIRCQLPDHGVIFVAFEDEGGKVDLNTASDELLLAVLENAGLAKDKAWAIVDAIVDFRDSDALKRANGAEAPEYAANKLPYPPKNSPFEDVGELEQVLGISPELYRKIAPALTVFSKQIGIDPVVATPKAMAVVSRLAAQEPTQVKRFLRPELVTPSSRNSFTIRSSSRLESGAIHARSAVIELVSDAKKPYRVRAWQRDLEPIAGLRDLANSPTTTTARLPSCRDVR